MASDDPVCGICGERRSAHVATAKGMYTHPREARGEGTYELVKEGHWQGYGVEREEEYIGPTYRFVESAKAVES
jgi:hypothetical protein